MTSKILPALKFNTLEVVQKNFLVSELKSISQGTSPVVQW